MQASIDEIRDYWNKRPCNIRHSGEPIGSAAWFEQTEKRKYFVEPHIPGFAEFEKWRDRRVLEIGCGTGTDTASFARAGAAVTAVDLSDESLRITSARLKVERLAASLYQGNAEKLSLAPQTFDLIYAFGSIHHSPNPEKIIQAVNSYRNPDTVLKIMVYNRFSWKVLWILLRYGKCQFWKLNDFIRNYSEAETECPVTHTYSEKSITELLEQNGWKVQSIQVDHIFPYSIPAYKRHKYKLAIPWKFVPKKLFRWLEKRIGWHLLVEAVPCQ